MISVSQKKHHYAVGFFMAAVIALSWYSPASGAVSAAQADSAYNAFYNHYWNSTNNTFYKYDNRTGS